MLFSNTIGGPMDSHNFNNRVMAPLRDKLQAHLGHKQITTTLGIYAQEVAKAVKAMVEADETAILSADELIAASCPLVGTKLFCKLL
jgi:hypothetical protein